MAALIRLAPFLALAAILSTHADPVDRWRPIVAEASARFGVPARWIERVIRAESAGRTTIHGRPIRSRAGAIGLMQLMPSTWQAMRARLRLGDDPDDPHDNILAGTFYLRLMYDRFGYPGLFAAYNAGPAHYAAYLAGKRPLPGETIAYLGALDGDVPQRHPVAQPPPLFAINRDAPRSAAPQSSANAPASLFAIEPGAP